MDRLISINFMVQVLFFIVYLLWQFEKIGFQEETMTHIISVLDIFETIIIIGTRFYRPVDTYLFMLGGFYVIEIILLSLQLIFSDLGVIIKLKSIFWIAMYIILFAYDILEINLILKFIQSDTIIAVDSFLKNSWLGSVLSAIILAAFKILFTVWAEKEQN